MNYYICIDFKPNTACNTLKNKKIIPNHTFNGVAQNDLPVSQIKYALQNPPE